MFCRSRSGKRFCAAAFTVAVLISGRSRGSNIGPQQIIHELESKFYMPAFAQNSRGIAVQRKSFNRVSEREMGD